MPSFSAINYSSRPSKSIQQKIVFDCLSLLDKQLGLRKNAQYIGLGSIWFTDFLLAHNRLDIERMISIENDEIRAKRARFNAPYSVVNVIKGHSNAVLPNLISDPDLTSSPWIVWLDYDSSIDGSVIEDIQLLIEKAPSNSILLFTANAVGSNYGDPEARPELLRSLFGKVVPDGLSRTKCRNKMLQKTLSKYALDFMKGLAASQSRLGGFLPAFEIPYKDGSPMITFGGILPSARVAKSIQTLIDSDTWEGFVEHSIEAPHLTLREAGGLQALLPFNGNLSRSEVQSLGFDLSEEELSIFQKYYKHYPSFAQVMT